MITGKWQKSETYQVKTPLGMFEEKITKVIIIEKRDYRLGGYEQVERTITNGTVTYSASYPACTEYAQMRRAGIVD